MRKTDIASYGSLLFLMMIILALAVSIEYLWGLEIDKGLLLAAVAYIRAVEIR